MSHLLSRFKHVLLVLSLLLTLGAISFIAPQAHAASARPNSKTQAAVPLINTANCRSLGNLIESEPINARTTGTKIGELDIYYNSSTGYNCAYLYAVGPAYGQAQYIEVEISTCQEGYGSEGCTWIQHDEDGNYSYRYYAGPVGVYGRGHCINVTSDLIWQNTLYAVGTKPFVSHCD